jgi:hypothetical protein
MKFEDVLIIARDSGCPIKRVDWDEGLELFAQDFEADDWTPVEDIFFEEGGSEAEEIAASSTDYD